MKSLVENEGIQTGAISRGLSSDVWIRDIPLGASLETARSIVRKIAPQPRFTTAYIDRHREQIRSLV